MKKSLVVLMALTLALVLGCLNDSESGQETQEFQREVQSQIDRMDDRISEAKRLGEDLPGDARSELNRQIAELETLKIALESKLDEMELASSDEWESFKVEVERASEKVESTINNLQEAFEEAL